MLRTVVRGTLKKQTFGHESKSINKKTQRRLQDCEKKRQAIYSKQKESPL